MKKRRRQRRCANSRFTVHDLVSPYDVEPFHGVQDARKLDLLKTDMLARGWCGRPVLVWADADGGLHALTGSHRIAAARSVRVPAIPVFVVVDSAAVEAFVDSGGASRTEDFDCVLREIGDDEALDLLRADER